MLNKLFYNVVDILGCFRL